MSFFLVPLLMSIRSVTLHYMEFEREREVGEEGKSIHPKSRKVYKRYVHMYKLKKLFILI